MIHPHLPTMAKSRTAATLVTSRLRDFASASCNPARLVPPLCASAPLAPHPCHPHCGSRERARRLQELPTSPCHAPLSTQRQVLSATRWTNKSVTWRRYVPMRCRLPARSATGTPSSTGYATADLCTHTHPKHTYTLRTHDILGLPGSHSGQVGDKKFVLLGEATHGTHEFYKARTEISQRLIREKVRSHTYTYTYTHTQYTQCTYPQLYLYCICFSCTH